MGYALTAIGTGVLLALAVVILLGLAGVHLTPEVGTLVGLVCGGVGCLAAMAVMDGRR